jgi:transposase
MSERQRRRILRQGCSWIITGKREPRIRELNRAAEARPWLLPIWLVWWSMVRREIAARNAQLLREIIEARQACPIEVERWR